MPIYFVSRHAGAIEWVRGQNIQVDVFVAHLDPAQVGAGDTIIGSLPVNLAAEICARGAAYWHVSVKLPADLRGQELSADDLTQLNARLERFTIQALYGTQP